MSCTKSMGRLYLMNMICYLKNYNQNVHFNTFHQYPNSFAGHSVHSLYRSTLTIANLSPTLFPFLHSLLPSNLEITNSWTHNHFRSCSLALLEYFQFFIWWFLYLPNVTSFLKNILKCHFYYKTSLHSFPYK